MAIVRPVMFTPIEDSEVVFNRPVSEETVRKMIQNSNLLAALAPVGSVRCIALNQPGVMTPSADQWQRSDGAEITNPQSPLTSVDPFIRYTPDFTNRYIRAADEQVEVENDIGGSYTMDLSHSHAIGAISGSAYGEEGEEQQAYALGHTHGVSSALSAAETTEVAHQEVGIYLKIN